MRLTVEWKPFVCQRSSPSQASSRGCQLQLIPFLTTTTLLHPSSDLTRGSSRDTTVGIALQHHPGTVRPPCKSGTRPADAASSSTTYRTVARSSNFTMATDVALETAMVGCSPSFCLNHGAGGFNSMLIFFRAELSSSCTPHTLQRSGLFACGPPLQAVGVLRSSVLRSPCFPRLHILASSSQLIPADLHQFFHPGAPWLLR